MHKTVHMKVEGLYGQALEGKGTELSVAPNFDMNCSPALTCLASSPAILPLLPLLQPHWSLCQPYSVLDMSCCSAVVSARTSLSPDAPRQIPSPPCLLKPHTEAHAGHPIQHCKPLHAPSPATCLSLFKSSYRLITHYIIYLLVLIICFYQPHHPAQGRSAGVMSRQCPAPTWRIWESTWSC